MPTSKVSKNNNAKTANSEGKLEKATITFLDGTEVRVSKTLDSDSNGKEKAAKSKGSGAYIANDDQFFYKVLPWTEEKKGDRAKEINLINDKQKGAVTRGNKELEFAISAKKKGTSDNFQRSQARKI